MAERIEITKPLTQPLNSGEYARSIKLDKGNPFGVAKGRYLITSMPGEVDSRAKLTLGPKTITEIAAQFPAEDGSGLFLVKVDSHHRRSRRS